MTTIRSHLQRLIGGLVLVIGIACAMGSYLLLSWLADDEVRQNAQEMTRQAELELDRLLLPPTSLLNLLSNVPDLKTGRLNDWIVRLPAQGSLLRANAMLESVYVGGPNGEYLNLREIKNPPPLLYVRGSIAPDARRDSFHVSSRRHMSSAAATLGAPCGIRRHIRIPRAPRDLRLDRLEDRVLLPEWREIRKAVNADAPASAAVDQRAHEQSGQGHKTSNRREDVNIPEEDQRVIDSRNGCVGHKQSKA